jgi:hypothetical protein
MAKLANAYAQAVVIRKRDIFTCRAVVDVVVVKQDGYDSLDQDGYVQIVVEFGSNKALKRKLMSLFKLGDLFEVMQGTYVPEFAPGKPPRLVLHTLEHVAVLQRSYWNIERIQLLQIKHLDIACHVRYSEAEKPARKGLRGNKDSNEGMGVGHQHKKITREEKLIQGEVVSSFVLDLMSTVGRKDGVEILSGGAGVVDVAGGNGWLALAFAKKGIPATVVDPRSSVGCLPKRDRKALRRAVKGQTKTPLAYQPTMFDTLRAYFGVKPEIRDEQGGKDDIPVCDVETPLFQTCAAVVALHPDQATGAVVEFAIKYRKPFVVVPCCVFSRLFPQRLNKDGTTVSTHADLIAYLQSLDPSSIKTTTLPFKGANVAVYGYF